MRKGLLLWKGRMPADALELVPGPDFGDTFDLVGIQNDVEREWEAVLRDHPSCYNGTLLFCTNFFNGSFPVGDLEFKVQRYLLRKGVKLPGFHGNLGFKLHLYDRQDRLLVGRRGQESLHLPGYISTIGGMFERIDTNLVGAVRREFSEECSMPPESICWDDLELVGIVKEEDGVCVDLVFEVGLSAEVDERVSGNEEWENGLWWAEKGTISDDELLEDILMLAWRRDT